MSVPVHSVASLVKLKWLSSTVHTILRPGTICVIAISQRCRSRTRWTKRSPPRLASPVRSADHQPRQLQTAAKTVYGACSTVKGEVKYRYPTVASLSWHGGGRYRP